MMEKDRRSFIKKVSALGSSALLIASNPLTSLAAEKDEKNEAQTDPTKPFTISILQTTDVHCQSIRTMNCFGNGKTVFRKTGGYAQLATYLKEARKDKAHTFLIDTGDMFQGSELSVKQLERPCYLF